jgi:hypothetical protein
MSATWLICFHSKFLSETFNFLFTWRIFFSVSYWTLMLLMRNSITEISFFISSKRTEVIVIIRLRIHWVRYVVSTLLRVIRTQNHFQGIQVLFLGNLNFVFKNSQIWWLLLIINVWRNWWLTVLGISLLLLLLLWFRLKSWYGPFTRIFR